MLTDYIRAGEDPDPSVAPALDGSFIIPVTVDDLAANGLLGDEYPQTCWERSVETLIARKEEITGLAIASDERIEAYLFNKGWRRSCLSGLSLMTLEPD